MGDSPTPLESLVIQPHILFLTEPGVYQLIFGSKLPSAENFQDWVFSEVLPSLRKTGSYPMNPVEKVKSITLEDFSECSERQIRKYKSTIKTHLNMLKDSVNKEDDGED